jgi:hypothetical protein
MLCVASMFGAVSAQAATAPPDTVVRRIVMKDARSALQFADQLKNMQVTGLFGGSPSPDPKNPHLGDIVFLPTGNYVLVAGEKDRVDKHMGDINMMAFMYERPRAHLQLSARVVELTGPSNNDVIQMTDTVRALVDAQRTEVVRAFADLQDYLQVRLKRRKGTDEAVYTEMRRIMPSLGDGNRPMTVPEILLLLMVDRALPDLPTDAPTGSGASNADQALVELQKRMTTALQDPHMTDEQIVLDVRGKLDAWKQSVTSAKTWCNDAVHSLENHTGGSIDDFLISLKDSRCNLPTWVSLRLRRSLELTERLYPGLCRRQAMESLSELGRRFQSALDREHGVESDISALSSSPNGSQDHPRVPGDLRRRLLDLQSVANDLVSVPMALFQSVAATADDASPTLSQLIHMFHDYADERSKMDTQLKTGDPSSLPGVDYGKLQMLESGLNLWIRRGCEAMARTLEQQFYNHYVDQIRVLANRQLGKLSSKDILATAGIEAVPDVVQDVLLGDSSVNLFVSNSISLQFEPDTTGSVSAQVAARAPSQLSIQDRLNAAAAAAGTLATINAAGQQQLAPGATAPTPTTPFTASPLAQFGQQYGLDGTDVVRSLLAGGQAVPIQSGINMTANPSIGFDGGTVTLTLSINETLSPTTGNITDHVTNHSINDATVSALSYEPMVLSTLTSNVSYYETSGGFPVLRQVPGLKDLLRDVPFAPFKEGKRSKGIYQSSVIILEPVVIPTVEDLIRFYSN